MPQLSSYSLIDSPVKCCCTLSTMSHVASRKCFPIPCPAFQQVTFEFLLWKDVLSHAPTGNAGCVSKFSGLRAECFEHPAGFNSVVFRYMCHPFGSRNPLTQWGELSRRKWSWDVLLMEHHILIILGWIGKAGQRLIRKAGASSKTLVISLHFLLSVKMLEGTPALLRTQRVG